MTNFAFLQTEWPDIYTSARRVEEYVQSDPRSACFHARRALELAVQWLYTHDRAFHTPYDDSLAALLHDPGFRQNVPPAIYTKAQLVRKEGNLAVHSRKDTPAQSAMSVAVELYHILYWLARTYTTADISAIPQQFDEKLLPPAPLNVLRKSVAQLKKQQADLKERDEALLKQQRENEALKAQLADIQAQITTQKAANRAIPDTHDYSEAETRRRIIDVLLREAGWDPAGPNVPEYPVTGMPFGQKTGYVDYVLWGDDGLPLALVEAKRTSIDPNQGKQQAKLCADCLAAMHDQRPIIFYTNGYTTYLWDDQRYPARRVQGFYTKDQLLLLIQRRSSAQPLANMAINPAIVNRAYQHEAIRRMTAHFSADHRKGLLVMATGSGKTRVAIALVDLLLRANRVKRVLFLADRSALVRQATNAFKTHLPHSNPVNLLESSGRDQAPAARVIDNTVNYAPSLIDDFSDSKKEPHIAISVDMLDTGIDVPEVVNLVFFKVVRSKTKFFQMIGRGTRLRPNLFGPGDDKTEFRIFDACLNFEYFSQNPEGVKTSQPEPLSQAIFKKRLALLTETRQRAKTKPDLAPLATTLADTLHSYVPAMNTANFIVRPQREHVDPFQARQRWDTLSRTDAANLAQYVSGLPSANTDDDETAKRFDLMLLDLQLAHLESAPRFNTLRDKIINLAANLETKTAIPRVNAQLAFIQELQTETFWAGITLPLMEEIRTRLRHLVTHADTTERKTIYTAFTDEGGLLIEVADVPYATSGVNIAQYKKKVEQFIRDHEDYVAIQKIRWGIPLNAEDLEALESFFYQAEEVGGQAQFVQIYGPQQNLAAFIRSLVGLDRGKAKERFAQFFDGKTYTADQIRFVTYIIDHLTANGTIAPELLYAQPYTDIHYEGLTGAFQTPRPKNC